MNTIQEKSRTRVGAILMMYKIFNLFLLVLILCLLIVNLHTLVGIENGLIKEPVKEIVEVKDFFILSKSFIPELTSNRKHLLVIDNNEDLLQIVNTCKNIRIDYANTFVIKLSNNEIVNYQIDEILLNESKESIK